MILYHLSKSQLIASIHSYTIILSNYERSGITESASYKNLMDFKQQYEAELKCRELMERTSL